MDISDNLKTLASRGFVFDEQFIKSEASILDCPFLNQIKYFLSIIKTGIKLIDGELPEDIVNLFCKEYETNRFMAPNSHFDEGGYFSIKRVKVVATYLSLISIDNDTISITPEGKEFLSLSDSCQFIFLFEQYGIHHNIAIYDRYKGGEFIQTLFLVLLSVLHFSEKPMTLRQSCSLLFKNYPSLKQSIKTDLISEHGEDKNELFYEIMQLRLIKRFFGLFNLIEYDKKYLKPSKFFLEIVPKADINEVYSKQFTSNALKEFKHRFEKLGYDVDLFSEFFVMSAILANSEEIPFHHAKNTIIKKYHVKDQDEIEFLNIHTDYYLTVGNFYNYLLDDRREDTSEDELIDFVYSKCNILIHQLPKTLLPMVLYKQIETTMMPSLFSIFGSYGIINDPRDFLPNIKEQMGEFVYEKVESFFQVMSHCKKEAQKSKRVSKELNEDFKLMIMSFIVVCWDVILYQED